MEVSKNNNKRKYREEVLNFFEYSEDDKTYKCKVEGCAQTLKSTYIYNLKRHIIGKHKDVARSLILESENECIVI